MKIQLASDLHLEFLRDVFPDERLILPAHGADILVLAGDIAEGTRAIELFAQWPTPVLYVAGNHEFYSQSFDQLRKDLRRATDGTSVHFLDKDVADFGGVRFLGATLWTDYCLFSPLMQPDLMKYAEGRLNDHRLIRTNDGVFNTAAALAEHERARRWLEQELAKPYDGKTVVITHHGPHPLSIHPRYLHPHPPGSPLNAAFVSNSLDSLLAKADLWVHGHVHDNFDYTVHGCRVIANPRGYVLNRYEASKATELNFENPVFQWACVIDIDNLSTTPATKRRVKGNQ